MEFSELPHQAVNIFSLAMVLTTVTALTALLIEYVWLWRDAAIRRALYLTALFACLVSPLVALMAVNGDWMLFRIPLIQGKAVVTMSAERVSDSSVITQISDAPGNSVKLGALTPATRSVLFPKQTLFFVLGAIWALGFIISIWRLAYGCVKLRRVQSGLIFSSRRLRHSPGHGKMLHEACRKAGLSTLPRVAISDCVGSPLVLGFWNPIIVLPADLIEQNDDGLLCDVLVHECAHIRGHDPLIGLLQRLVAAQYWFHPLIHVLNRNLCAAQEDVCDNAVLKYTSAPVYASRIVDLLEKTSLLHRLPTAAGMSLSRGTMTERIASLLNKERTLSTQVSLRTLAPLIASFCALVAFIAGVSLHAEDQKAPAPAKPHEVTPDDKPDNGGTELVIYDISDLEDKVTLNDIKGYVQWKDSPGISIESSGNKFVISQTPRVHKKIATYLAACRAHAKPEVVGEAWVKDLQAKLDKKITLDFINMPISEAIDLIRSLYGVTFILDPVVTADGTDMKPVSFKASDVEVSAALDAILKLLDLRYELKDNAVFITRIKEQVSAKPMISVKTTLVSGRLDQLVPGVDRNPGGQVISESTLTKLMSNLKNDARVEVLTCPVISLFPKQAGNVSITQQQTYVDGYKLSKNERGELIRDPVIKTLDTGTIITVIASPGAEPDKFEIDEKIKITELVRMDKAERNYTIETTEAKPQSITMAVDVPVIDSHGAGGVQSIRSGDAWVIAIPQKGADKPKFAIISASRTN